MQNRYTIPRLADLERGACGIGFIANRYGRASHAILEQAITGLTHMQHRGGLSSDNTTGDGAGILLSIPYQFFAREWARLTKFYPEPQDLAVGVFFLNPAIASNAHRQIEQALRAHGITQFVWRKTPVNPAVLGQRAIETQPQIDQLLCLRPADATPGSFERRLFLARKQFERHARHQNWRAYVASFSSHTLVYKGLMLAPQLAGFYLDLQDPNFMVAVACFHQRYSTNTLPSWERAQPFRALCHNGEINTLQGNIAWTHACAPTMHAEFEDDEFAFTPETLNPVLDLTGSDSAMLDNMLETLHLGGRDLRHAMAMLMPTAWEGNPELSPAVHDFYAFHAYLQEPWDGPAAVVFTNGEVVGATLDRNGLRPLRYSMTGDLVVVASEEGAIALPEAEIEGRGKLGPGQMIALDTTTGKVWDDTTLKQHLASTRDYGELLLDAVLPEVPIPAPSDDLIQQQAAFGYTHEEMVVMLRPMAETGKEPVGSMGDDTPPAVLTAQPRPLFSYFRQRFAEVTNPAIDPLRETLVMSLTMHLGRAGNRLAEKPDFGQHITLPSPILSPGQLEQLLAQTVIPARRVSTLFPVAAGPAGLALALDGLQAAVWQAVTDGIEMLVLSDRGVDSQHTFIPSLLALAATHHQLLRDGLRGKVSLVVESGEPRDIHQIATLIGYGAGAVCPYIGWETAAAVSRQHDEQTARQNYRWALEAGLRKVMSKIGISTIDAYGGAQIFEVIGLATEIVERHFTGTASHTPGATLDDLGQIVVQWHQTAFGGQRAKLPSPGFYKFKRSGEVHAFSPAVVRALHDAVQLPGADGDQFEAAFELYEKFTALIAEAPPADLRGLLDIHAAPQPLDLAQIEGRETIIRRFSGAAMSHGSISAEAHETIATGMNLMGSWSNSGEGGESRERFNALANSRIKQIASGRFGVTPEYLLSADELQIKIAQGAKPGEGGQLPGFKVSAEIATIRHSQPGITLISPPPHHDIYSIEDLAQLIFDLRQINPRAAISVKLVSEAGVGTIAAGVAKAGADVIGISGHNGGTGAAVWSSIKSAGLPWELGLAETQSALVNSGLRGQVRIRVDGGLRDGRDVIVGALLGADEFSFGTSALVAVGCVMARACHRNICPAGIATQRRELRDKFIGKPEHVVAYMNLVAEDVRRWLARMGFATLEAVVGRSDLLRQMLPGLPGQPEIDLGGLCQLPVGAGPIRFANDNTRIARVEPLNRALRTDALFSVRTGRSIQLSYAINNSNRTFGALLASEIVNRRGPEGLPDGTIAVRAYGIAGQSFGAFNVPGLNLALFGAANDYVGKGMGGGQITIAPHADYAGAHPTLAGNTVLYGATAGRLYVAGRAGERFAVRNSGAFAVVEGVGDHGCEYMTGGRVVILGRTGLNFGAGMTGGVAYIWDEDGHLARRLNDDVVLAGLTEKDTELLCAWLQQHVELTGSSRARQLIDNWQQTLSQFRRVIPHEQAKTVEAVDDEHPESLAV